MRALLVILSLFATPAIGGVDVMFQEGAPKDRFVITNTGCPLTDVTLVIDLSTAPAGVIFDVTGQGAGVEVFQPIEVVSGEVAIAPVVDGDQVLHMHFPVFAPAEQVIISADLDDQSSQSDLGQIRVSGSEIAGASVAMVANGLQTDARFDVDAAARLSPAEGVDGCVST